MKKIEFITGYAILVVMAFLSGAVAGAFLWILYQIIPIQ